MGHELRGHLVRERRIEAGTDVDRNQFLLLALGVGVQFRALTGEFSLFGVGLGLDRHVLPGGHRHRPRDQASNPRDHDVAVRRVSRGHPQHQDAVDTMPSFAPRTAARSQPMRPVRCRSLW